MYIQGASNCATGYSATLYLLDRPAAIILTLISKTTPMLGAVMLNSEPTGSANTFALCSLVWPGLAAARNRFGLAPWRIPPHRKSLGRIPRERWLTASKTRARGRGGETDPEKAWPWCVNHHQCLAPVRIAVDSATREKCNLLHLLPAGKGFCVTGVSIWAADGLSLSTRD